MTRLSRKFFTIENPMDRMAIWGDGDFVAMNRANRIETVSEPIRVEIQGGKRMLDVIWVGVFPLFSNRAVDLMLGARLTGWRTYDVDVISDTGRRMEGYSGLTITGRCGEVYLDAEHSEVIYENLPAARAPFFRGIWFDESLWDGSDFFLSSSAHKSFKFTSERVRQVLSGCDNILFRPVEDTKLLAMELPSLPL